MLRNYCETVYDVSYIETEIFSAQNRPHIPSTAKAGPLTVQAMAAYDIQRSIRRELKTLRERDRNGQYHMLDSRD